jgi:hypothetical protein
MSDQPINRRTWLNNLTSYHTFLQAAISHLCGLKEATTNPRATPAPSYPTVAGTCLRSSSLWRLSWDRSSLHAGVLFNSKPHLHLGFGSACPSSSSTWWRMPVWSGYLRRHPLHQPPSAHSYCYPVVLHSLTSYTHSRSGCSPHRSTVVIHHSEFGDLTWFLTF